MTLSKSPQATREAMRTDRIIIEPPSRSDRVITGPRRPSCQQVLTARPCYPREMADASALTFRGRWEMVRQRLAREAARATYDEKLAQLESLMGSVDDFGWREKLGADDDRVRALWMKLRRAWPHG